MLNNGINGGANGANGGARLEACTDRQQLEDVLGARWAALSRRLSAAARQIKDSRSVIQVYGRLVRLAGMTMEVEGCALKTGQRCMVKGPGGQVEAEVVGFDRTRLFLMPVEYGDGMGSGDQVYPLERDTSVLVGEELIGRVVNGLAAPLDGLGPLQCRHPIRLHTPAINPLERGLVQEPLDVGIRAINGLLTLGCGQRVGLLSPTGVGKSTLLGMMIRNTTADVTILAMIGERGREIREFAEKILGPEGMRKAIIVAAPADHSPVMRLRAALVAHRVAEFFRDKGRKVLLLMDSLTRYAQAQREIALAVGEPPSARGYPPSAFSMMSRLVERAGNGTNGQGSVSAVYTVLVEGEDSEDPVAESARAILDGHIVLSREQAVSGLYPAVDLAASVSRTMASCVTARHLQNASRFLYLAEKDRTGRELALLGAYQQGNDQEIDLGMRCGTSMRAYLSQGMDECVSLEQSQQQLEAMLNEQDTAAGAASGSAAPAAESGEAAVAPAAG